MSFLDPAFACDAADLDAYRRLGYRIFPRFLSGKGLSATVERWTICCGACARAIRRRS
ncbi:MAG TPA: hypothetical protein VEL07_19160 [Planctomycetota bacterium]|nr:hypothetical protein [Planctomycetota bacterium]